MKEEILRAWREPRVGARLAWREDPLVPWIPVTFALFVLAVLVMNGAPLLSLRTLGIAVAAYGLCALWSWAWSFATRGITVYGRKIVIRQGRYPREIRFTELARAEGEMRVEGPAIRLVTESGRSSRILLGPGVNLDSLEEIFRRAAVPWKSANQPPAPIRAKGPHDSS